MKPLIELSAKTEIAILKDIFNEFFLNLEGDMLWEAFDTFEEDCLLLQKRIDKEIPPIVCPESILDPNLISSPEYEEYVKKCNENEDKRRDLHFDEFEKVKKKFIKNLKKCFLD